MGRKWVFKPGHPKANERGFVAWEDYAGPEEARALDAPIMMDRFYENTSSPIDGQDIGSRRKHREYMKRNNLISSDDFRGTWGKAEEMRREVREKGVLPDKSRREDVGRAIYNLYKP